MQRSQLDGALGAVLGICLLCTIVPARAAGRPAPQRTLRGTLQVLQEDDFATRSGRRLYAVVTSEGGRVPVEFLREPGERLASGARVRLRGVERDGRLTVDGAASGAVEILAPAATVTGERRAVVLVVDFSDAAVGCTDAVIAQLMFDGVQSVAGLYDETSFGSVRFPADTDGDGAADVFRVSLATGAAGTCDAQNWANLADAEAQAQVDLGNYRHRVYVLPQAAGCSWAGLANVGCGSFCRAWITTCSLPDVYAHELGHNLGMAHASTDDDHDGAVDSEYGDRSDFMGIGGVGYRHTNGPHKQQMGWLPEPQVIEASAGSATHVLSPLHLDPGIAVYPQLLRIRRPNGGDDYFVSYRSRGGYDTGLSSSYADKASIHTYRGSGAANTLFVGALADGEELIDPRGGVRITQIGHDPVSATLLVEVDGECVRAAPQVELSPLSGLGRPTDVVAYAARVTNTDASNCAAASFDMAPQLPPGWTGQLDRSSLVLAPGEQGSAELRVGSAAAAADGPYAVELAASHGEDGNLRSVAAATYEVDGTPPPTVGGLHVSARAGYRAWLVWDPVTDGGEPVAGYRVYRDGAQIGTAVSRRFLDTTLEPETSHAYQVTAVDAAGNESEAGTPVEVRPSTRYSDPYRGRSTRGR